jgi:hypothetical protein
MFSQSGKIPTGLPDLLTFHAGGLSEVDLPVPSDKIWIYCMHMLLVIISSCLALFMPVYLLNFLLTSDADKNLLNSWFLIRHGCSFIILVHFNIKEWAVGVRPCIFSLPILAVSRVLCFLNSSCFISTKDLFWPLQSLLSGWSRFACNSICNPHYCIWGSSFPNRWQLEWYIIINIFVMVGYLLYK